MIMAYCLHFWWIRRISPGAFAKEANLEISGIMHSGDSGFQDTANENLAVQAGLTAFARSKKEAEVKGTGLQHWETFRASWTADLGPRPVSEEEKAERAALLAKITPENYELIYKQLVAKGRRLQQSIPLSYVVNVLISGWKVLGLLPADVPVPSTNPSVS
ncbi:hypothetical protein BJ684DRAFT_20922 [Piptocephalis cylindrospora]|uniref:Gag1-like clamp domain-containing protein n=1 Tax=Piptocephalis cylindrospora TaxID=1907219 RepID=A0A4P9Y140_9FUNG|nr:hypothetical protein BJ684DRAFT_20922 [Piptocephalis cylindrospora]|eukprot:RKP12546.1 hypothetical protein BJ684DRAFT_20922 [Piptocephalis cylindrospora]